MFCDEKDRRLPVQRAWTAPAQSFAKSRDGVTLELTGVIWHREQKSNGLTRHGILFEDVRRSVRAASIVMPKPSRRDFGV